jgi:hypothetical protein
MAIDPATADGPFSSSAATTTISSKSFGTVIPLFLDSR